MEYQENQNKEDKDHIENNEKSLDEKKKLQEQQQQQ